MIGVRSQSREDKRQDSTAISIVTGGCLRPFDNFDSIIFGIYVSSRLNYKHVVHNK